MAKVFCFFFSKKKALLALKTTTWARSIATGLTVWAATRLVFLLIGEYSFRLNGQPVPWLGMWIQWDSSFYLGIADHGYVPPTVVTGLESGQSNINFFPALPLLIALLRLVVPSTQAAGLLAANLCLLVAAVVLHRLAARRLDRVAADWTVLSLMAVPGSFAFSSPLSEAPFLAFSITAAYASEVNKGVAAVSSAFLTITRWTGILQGLGFALDWLVERFRGGDASYRRLLLICLIPLPLLVLLFVMFHVTGDAFAALHSNTTFWQQKFGFPFQSLVLFLHTDQPRLEIQSVLACVLLLVTLSQIRCFSAGEMLFVIGSVASFASSDAASPSLIRYTIGLYPVHLAMGRLCGRYPAMRLLLLCLAVIGGAIAALWFHGGDVYV